MEGVEYVCQLSQMPLSETCGLSGIFFFNNVCERCAVEVICSFINYNSVINNGRILCV